MQTSVLRFRKIAFVSIAVVLIWLVAAKSVGIYFGEDLDDAAVELQKAAAANPAGAADPNLGSDTDDAARAAEAERIAAIRSLAEETLRDDPLSARAFRILGQLAERSADEAQTEKLMHAAVQRSLRESIAVDWMIRKSLERADYATAAIYADALLRTRPQLVAYVTAILGKFADDPAGAEELKKLLAGNPPWRSLFFYHLPANISDARTPLAVLLSLKDAGSPPSMAEIRPYLNFLVERKLFEIAYYTWLQFLTPEQLSRAGFLYNGSFEIAPSGLPFDWILTSGSGATTDIAIAPDKKGERALYTEFGYGRVDFRGATQLIMLAPGTYEFSGKYRGEISGRRGLVWRISCAGGASISIGESPMALGATPTWINFSFAFTVPAANCRAQYVRLVLDARSTSEQLISGFIWYDELEIVRQSNEP